MEHSYSPGCRTETSDYDHCLTNADIDSYANGIGYLQSASLELRFFLGFSVVVFDMEANCDVS